MHTTELREEFFAKVLNDEWSEYILPLKTALTYYKCAVMELETKFNVLDSQFNLQYDRNPIETIKSRIKSVDGIIKKLKRINCDITVENMEKYLFDIAGIRVISSFENDMYLLAESLLKQDDIRLIETKDYIKHPKPNGYRSLHLIVEVPIFLADEKKWVKAEIQFRTIAMDLWASLEHKIKYKKHIAEDKLHTVQSALFECAQICACLDKKMEAVKNTAQAAD